MADKVYKVGQTLRRIKDNRGSYVGFVYKVELREWKFSDKKDKLELTAVGQGKNDFITEKLSSHLADEYEVVE